MELVFSFGIRFEFQSPPLSCMTWNKSPFDSCLFFFFCSKVPQSLWFKTEHYLRFPQVRHAKWVSLGWHQGVFRLWSLPKGPGEGSSLTLCSFQRPPTFLACRPPSIPKLVALGTQVFLLLLSLWFFLLIPSSYFWWSQWTPRDKPG